MRYAKTEWGIDVKVFTQRYGMTMKALASRAGVCYNTLLQVSIGKTPGNKTELIEKVEAFMADHSSKNDPTVNRALRAFGDAPR